MTIYLSKYQSTFDRGLIHDRKVINLNLTDVSERIFCVHLFIIMTVNVRNIKERVIQLPRVIQTQSMYFCKDKIIKLPLKGKKWIIYIGVVQIVYEKVISVPRNIK